MSTEFTDTIIRNCDRAIETLRNQLSQNSRDAERNMHERDRLTHELQIEEHRRAERLRSIRRDEENERRRMNK